MDLRTTLAMQSLNNTQKRSAISPLSFKNQQEQFKPTYYPVQNVILQNVAEAERTNALKKMREKPEPENFTKGKTQIMRLIKNPIQELSPINAKTQNVKRNAMSETQRSYQILLKQFPQENEPEMQNLYIETPNQRALEKIQPLKASTVRENDQLIMKYTQKNNEHEKQKSPLKKLSEPPEQDKFAKSPEKHKSQAHAAYSPLKLAKAGESPKKRDNKADQKTKQIENEETNTILSQPRNSVESKPAEQSPVKNHSAESKPAEQNPVNNHPSESKPAEQNPVKNHPSESKPAEQSPVKNHPSESKPAEQSPVKNHPSESKPAEQSPVKNHSAESKPAEQNPVKNHPSESKPAEQSPVKNHPSESKPAEQSPVKNHPSESKPAEQSPVKNHPSESKPAEQSPVKNHSSESKPAEQNPVKNHPSESKPAEQSPVKNHPSESKPAEQSPVKNHPSESKPAEQSPVKNHPSESKPAEQKLIDQSQSPKKKQKNKSQSSQENKQLLNNNISEIQLQDNPSLLSSQLKSLTDLQVNNQSDSIYQQQNKASESTVQMNDPSKLTSYMYNSNNPSLSMSISASVRQPQQVDVNNITLSPMKNESTKDEKASIDQSQNAVNDLEL
ncbi:Conserved_hypothetical protein [Hexamita inflata]|uniref:Uncharacterized protein n=1 Tax=Hexamita inflata TaxID=28002 RepID=A0AA86RIQ8_9EUKA|nr:Conserved hypothetical protein [Hexamita inflata]